MKTSTILSALLVLCLNFSNAQKKSNNDNHPIDSIDIDGLKWRGIGPALTSGRISDIAVNPLDPYEYYVAAASGGVWKTVNAGVEFKPIFDNEGSYSIGCITIDPNNPNAIWVGTGENNNQRSVAYGDGVYKSIDGGKSWLNMGLTKSEHIGKIIIHPEDSDIVYVAAYGPLWSKGGERGLYKTTDGGKTWKAVLTIDEHTGVNDVVMDPRDPDVLYAASHQRRRHVYTYVGGGPGSGIHKSTDGGKTWNRINKGLPKTELGRIGLAISQADAEIIYAIVEASDKKGGFFRSTNRGANWEKRSKEVTSGNYYQEIFTDTKDPKMVYSMNVWMTVSHDGGKTFKKVGEDYKHVDNHCMWIDPANNKHWLVGCDGGMYETYDAAKTWDFKGNLPVVQFYKVAVDNDKPFYNIYGGTQDNFTIGGPSRVITDHGITNQDWIITNGGDGFESQVDLDNPDIVYSQSQHGWLVRFDRKSGEQVGIQPKERKDENTYRWNWDAPLAVSKHAKGRLYFAANKVFRSNDYGNSWEVISEDLTRQIDRNELKVYDRMVSIDAVAKNGSTSLYGTIVALSESTIDKDLIAIGTDDGLIQITENGGRSWRKVDNIPGVPAQTYVNSVYLSKHNMNVIYAAFNHHKYGDFKPYIFKSTDKGRSWFKISSNLPERGSVYAIEEDHINPGLLFCGTEFGVFFSPNGGKRWKKIGNGLPTIAVRDIAIQERENDLVLGTFGRGFFVLDDYSPLREIGSDLNSSKAKIYPIRDASMWEKSLPLGLPGKAFQGDNLYSAQNLGPETVITYYYDENYESLREQRQKKEKKLIKEDKNVSYPDYNSLKAEVDEIKPQLIFTFKDSNGKVIKKIIKKPKKGLQRFNWNLRYEQPNPIDLSKSSFYNPFAGNKEGTLINPGTYTVEIHLFQNGNMILLTKPVSFNVKSLENTTMPAVDRASKVAFQKDVALLIAQMKESQQKINEMNKKLKYIKEGINLSELPYGELSKLTLEFESEIKKVNTMLNGDNVKRKLDIDQKPSPSTRIAYIYYEQKHSSADPTKTHLDSYAIAKEEYSVIQQNVDKIYNVDFKKLEEKLKNLGVPYTPGRMSNSEKE